MKKTGLIQNEHYDILDNISHSFEQTMKSDISKTKKVTFFLGKLKQGCEFNRAGFQWLDKKTAEDLYRYQNGLRCIVDHEKFDRMMDRFEALIIDNDL